MAETEIVSERRYAVLQITPEFFVEMCKRKGVKQIFEVTENAVPDDARFVGIGPLNSIVNNPRSVFDISHAVLGILIESPSFPPVRANEPCTILAPPMFRLIRDEQEETEVKLKCPACGGEAVDDLTAGVRSCACGWSRRLR